MASTRNKMTDQDILLGVLGAVDRADVTQRRISSELGIAVGLVNTYIKRCVNKGLIKVREIPPRRYVYYLTAQGMLEKSRLVAEYFVGSFDFFRHAKVSCEATLLSMAAAGCRRIAMAGASELAEIAMIVATDIEIEIVAVIDQQSSKSWLLGIPIKSDIATVEKDVDAVMITSLSAPQPTYESAVAMLGAKRVFLPSILADIAVRKDGFRTNTKRKGTK